MTDHELEKIVKQLKSMLEKRIGQNPDALHADVWRRALEDRMYACHLQNDPEEYLKFLKANPKELQQFIELILVNETWFFRDSVSFEFVADLAYLAWKKRPKNSPPLRFLIAPCASGEEAYSLAIFLKEKGIPLHDVEIEAVDISKEALMRAELGLYGNNSFRSSDFKISEKYFTKKEPHRFQIHESILSAVKFQFANLVDPVFFIDRPPYFAVFCKNLLIYLTSNVQKKLLQNFKKILDKEGLLVVGPSEAELARKEGYIPVEKAKYLTFRKAEKVKKDVDIASEKIEVVEKQEKVFFPKMTLTNSPKPVPSISPLLQEAGDLADSGKFAQALKKCQKYTSANPLDPESHFLLGVIHHALGNLEEAEEAFQKSIYLKPNHYGSLIYLALLAEKKGMDEKAALYRRRAEKEKEQLSTT